jgi:hypothetical protein
MLTLCALEAAAMSILIGVVIGHLFRKPSTDQRNVVLHLYPTRYKYTGYQCWLRVSEPAEDFVFVLCTRPCLRTDSVRYGGI